MRDPARAEVNYAVVWLDDAAVVLFECRNTAIVDMVDESRYRVPLEV